MTTRIGRCVRAAFLAAGLVAAIGGGLAPAPVRAAPAAESYTFAFREAEISQVAEEILGATLGITYTIDPSVSGKMSFRVEKRMTKSQLLEAFEAALAANGVVMIRQGESLLLTSRAGARAAGGVRSGPERSARAGYEVVAAPIRHATPSEVAKVLQSVGPKDVVVHVDDATGVILLGGTRGEIEAALATIQVFDRSSLEGARTRWFELSQASAPAVASEINQLLQASGTSGANVVPLRRLNGLIAFARTQGALDDIGRWVERLDRAAGDEAATLWVYHPRNVSAESLATTLSRVVPGAAAYTPSVPTSAGEGTQPPAAATTLAQAPATTGDEAVRIGVDRESNTLLIAAPPAQRVQIQKVLDEIDVTPSQVLIEATILEVTLSDEFRLGVNWQAIGEGGKLKVISTSDEAGGVAPTLPGFAVTFIDDDIRAAVDALGARTAVEVVSAPKIVTVNNRTAVLQIGDQVPIVNQTAQSNAAPDAPRVVTVDYRDTGVILNVTPRVSGEDTVMLTIAQEVSSVAKTTTSGIDSPTIQQRRLESTLMLRDGRAVALGGLFSTNRSNNDSGVPYLKDVPGLGTLFKSQSRDVRRTELIVLITVRIMRGEEATDRVMTELLDDLKEIQARGLVRQ